MEESGSIEDLSLIIAGLKECSFLEREVTQTLDRAESGYPDEWQFLLLGLTFDNKPYKKELVYYRAHESSPAKKFIQEYKSKVDKYKTAYPNLRVDAENVHHSKGIRHNPKVPLRK